MCNGSDHVGQPIAMSLQPPPRTVSAFPFAMIMTRPRAREGHQPSGLTRSEIGQIAPNRDMDLRGIESRMIRYEALSRSTLTHASQMSEGHDVRYRLRANNIAQGSRNGRLGSIEPLPLISVSACSSKRLRFRKGTCLLDQSVGVSLQNSGIIARQVARFQIEHDDGRAQCARPITCVRQLTHGPRLIVPRPPF